MHDGPRSEEQFLARSDSAKIRICEFPDAGPRRPSDRQISKLHRVSERSTVVNEHWVALLLFRFLAKDKGRKCVPFGSQMGVLKSTDPPLFVGVTFQPDIREIRFKESGSKIYSCRSAHIRATEVQRWIDQGWLKARVVETGRLKKEIIYADDFAELCKRYRNVIIGHRLNTDRLGLCTISSFLQATLNCFPCARARRNGRLSTPWLQQADYQRTRSWTTIVMISRA